jgi:hypothetical protein
VTSLVIARLNDRAQPMDRGELYEDPLHALLQSRGWGEVSGGGSQLASSGEIAYCEVEIGLHGDSPAALEGIIAELERCGAPKGSLLRGAGIGADRPFGVTEGLAVYLNGTDLPDATYRDSDVNFVFSEFNRLLQGQGKIHSYWQGPTETALYMYGTSFEGMRAALAPFLDSYPLCERARVVQVA